MKLHDSFHLTPLPQENRPPKKIWLHFGIWTKWCRVDYEINDFIPSNFAPSFSLSPGLYTDSCHCSLHHKDACYPESSWQQKAISQARIHAVPWCLEKTRLDMVRVCWSFQTVRQTVRSLQLNLANMPQRRRFSNELYGLETSWLCRRFIESARSVVQSSKSQKDWLPCTSNRRVRMRRYSLTNTRSRKSVA